MVSGNVPYNDPYSFLLFSLMTKSFKEDAVICNVKLIISIPRSLVSPLASSGFNSPYGALGGNYLQGVRFGHDGSSAGFGGFGSKGGKTAGYGRK